MFGIAPSELLVVALLAIVIIGPKDLPIALRTAGKWISKMRQMSAHFRSGIESIIREAEMEEMEKKWQEQKAATMAQPPVPVADGPADAANFPEIAIAHSASSETTTPRAQDTGAASLRTAHLEHYHGEMPAAQEVTSELTDGNLPDFRPAPVRSAH